MRLALWCVVGLLVGCGDNVKPGPTDISLDQTTVSLALHATVELHANVTFPTGSAFTTADISWTSSDATIVGVDGNGDTATLTGLAPGMASVTVSIGGLSAVADVTVKGTTLVAIAVTPQDPTVEKGQTVTMTATGTYSDGSTADLTTMVAWASSDTTVATIDAGVATTLAAGTTTITATDATSGVAGNSLLTVKNASLVSIAVAPDPASIAKGTTQAFTATGHFSDGSTADLTSSAMWSSSDETTAPISSSGVATGQAVGTSTITATDVVSGVSGTAHLTVRAADLVSIEVTPPMPSIAKGTTQAFTATGTFTDGTMQDLTTTVTWGSSNTTVATIGSSGVATAKAVGMTTISATSGIISGSTTLTVSPAALVSIAITPANPTIARTTKQAFSAVGTYTDGTTQNLTTTVTWSSSDTGVATISNTSPTRGVATGVAAGTTTIRATSGTIVGTTMLTVTSATLVSITVTPPDPSLPKGRKQQFIATGTFSDGSNQDITISVSWSSSDTGVATISNAAGIQGLATSVAVGGTTITATLGGIMGSTSLTVTPPVLITFTITPANPTIATGDMQAFLATGTYSDNSTRDITATVTWRSSNTSVAVISNAAGTQGVAVGLLAGTASIGAVDAATTITRQTTLTVTP